MTAIEAAIPELKALPLFKDYSSEQMLRITQGGSIQFSNHRDLLFSQGNPADYFGIVISGAYKLSKISPIGEDVIVHFSTPGDVLAAFIMAMPNPRFPISAKAMGPSRFLKIPKTTYIEAWLKHPELIFKIQNLLSTRMNLLQDQKALTKAPLSAKVALLLVKLIEKQPEDSANIVPIPLTRKEIAESLGASVESVIRIMSEWSKSGLVSTNDQQIQVLRADKLVELFCPIE